MQAQANELPYSMPWPALSQLTSDQASTWLIDVEAVGGPSPSSIVSDDAVYKRCHF